MREPLYRGKSKYSDEWVYGVPVQNLDGDWQIVTRDSKTAVIPESIGQFIGTNDKNGDKIFEDDVVVYSDENLKVEYDNDNVAFILRGDDWYAPFNILLGNECEIIGNAYDNPELLVFSGGDDVCYECRGYGDDYGYDEKTGNSVCNCDDCPNNRSKSED